MLDATYSEYYVATEVDEAFSYEKTKQGADDVFRGLYRDEGKATVDFGQGITIPGKVTSGYQYNDDLVSVDPGVAYLELLDVVCSEALRLEAAISTKVPSRIRIEGRVDADVETVTGQRSIGRTFITKAKALVRKVPGFFYTSYRFGADGSNVLVTYNTYRKLMVGTTEYAGVNVTWPEVIPKGRLFVKMADGSDLFDREVIINNIKTFIRDDFTTVTDTQSLVESTDTATTMILLFFTIVGLITTILSFSSLLLTFYSNVNDNAWQFGVLRSIGLTVRQLQVAYIYEGLCLVLSSLILGTFVGIVMAITLSLQFNVFIELPFVFRFPTVLFVVMAVCSLLSAVIGAYLPSRMLAKQVVAEVIRG